MQDKKYYSISEVTKILQIHSHTLRYLEKKLPSLVIQKVKNRRYYTKEDIECLERHILSSNKSKSPDFCQSPYHLHTVNRLIKNFRALEEQIQLVIRKLSET